MGACVLYEITYSIFCTYTKSLIFLIIMPIHNLLIFLLIPVQLHVALGRDCCLMHHSINFVFLHKISTISSASAVAKAVRLEFVFLLKQEKVPCHQLLWLVSHLATLPPIVSILILILTL